MANQQALCGSFRVELLQGLHQFTAQTIVSRGSLTAPTPDTFKAALYYATATLNADTTAYSTTGEVTGTNYAAGGVTVAYANAPLVTTGVASTATAYLTPSANIVFSNVTISSANFDTCLIYNATQNGRAVSVHTFTPQTITAGTLTLTMPTNSSSAALLRLA